MSLQLSLISDASAIVIEIAGKPAGFAVKDDEGYQFFAIDDRYAMLDGGRFPRILQLKNAARGLAQAKAHPPGSR